MLEVITLMMEKHMLAQVNADLGNPNLPVHFIKNCIHFTPILRSTQEINIQHTYTLPGLHANKFPRGGGKFGVRTKGGGGSLCEVLHPILARGGGDENDTRGGKFPLPAPLNTALPA